MANVRIDCTWCDKMHTVSVLGVSNEDLKANKALRLEVADRFFDRHLPEHVQDLMEEWEEADDDLDDRGDS